MYYSSRGSGKSKFLNTFLDPGHNKYRKSFYLGFFFRQAAGGGHQQPAAGGGVLRREQQGRGQGSRGGGERCPPLPHLGGQEASGCDQQVLVIKGLDVPMPH